MIGVTQGALDQGVDLAWRDKGVVVGAVLSEIGVTLHRQSQNRAHGQGRVVGLGLVAGEESFRFEARQLARQGGGRLTPLVR